MKINRRTMYWCVRTSQIHAVNRMVGEKAVIRNDKDLPGLTDVSSVTRGVKVFWIKIHNPFNIAGLAPGSTATIVI